MRLQPCSQLLCSWLSDVAGSIVEHGEDDTDQLVGRGEQGLLEGKALRLSPDKIGLEGPFHPNRTEGH